MARTDMYAYVVGIFEYDSDQAGALNYLLSALDGSGVEDFQVLEIEVTQWSDPIANVPLEITRAAGTFRKFTMTVQMRFVIDGGYPEAQQWLANKLYAEESKTHMNIQTMRLSGAKAAG
nr:MAG TPA: hypothetical protein [Caudoviricetes sp.]